VTNAVEKNRAAPPPFSYSEEISAVPRDNDSLAVEGALNDGEAPESYDWASEESVPAVEETKSLEPGDRGGGQSVIPRKELHYRLVFQTVFTRHPGWKDSFRDKLKANSIYKDGAYYLFITWPDYGVIVYPEIEMNDFMVRLECEVIHDRHSYCGIAFRINNRASNAFYTCCLFKITQGWVTITDESADDRFGRSMYHRECEHVKDITSINTLTMAKVGYGATFWVNGMDVTSIIDDRFSTGCVGIYAGTRGGNHPQESLVRFRKFEVYAIE
jgi:hypothetical protein